MVQNQLIKEAKHVHKSVRHTLAQHIKELNLFQLKDTDIEKAQAKMGRGKDAEITLLTEQCKTRFAGITMNLTWHIHQQWETIDRKHYLTSSLIQN